MLKHVTLLGGGRGAGAGTTMMVVGVGAGLGGGGGWRLGGGGGWRLGDGGGGLGGVRQRSTGVVQLGSASQEPSSWAALSAQQAGRAEGPREPQVPPTSGGVSSASPCFRRRPPALQRAGGEHGALQMGNKRRPQEEESKGHRDRGTSGERRPPPSCSPALRFFVPPWPCASFPVPFGVALDC